MFSKPKAGRTTVSYKGAKLGEATDAAGAVIPALTACLEYLKQYFIAPGAFNLTFDAKDHEFGIVLINGDFYAWSNGEGGPVPKLALLSDEDCMLEAEWVRRLAKEIIKDVKDNIDGWAAFEATDLYGSSEETEKYFNDARDEIVKLIGELEGYDNERRPELGNILYGNSRGEYPIQRGEYEKAFCKFLEDCGFDSYGYPVLDFLDKDMILIEGDEMTLDSDGKEVPEHTHAFDNGVFRLMPYFWGESENIAAMPNFVFYPWNVVPEEGSRELRPYELQWYKYPMRDAYSNMPLDIRKFREMLEICRQSVIRSGSRS